VDEFKPMEVAVARQRIGDLLTMLADRPSSMLCADIGSSYFTLSEPETARLYLEKAWDKNKTVAGIAMNLALTYKDLGLHDEAMKMMEKAFAIAPQEDFYIRLGLQESLLKHGFWQQAWALTETRPSQQNAAYDLRLPAVVKKWDGSPLPEGHVLIVANEGGFGDRLNYARWLPKLTEMGINWKFYPSMPLFAFFERVFPRDRLIADGDIIVPDPTHWTTTFGLPQDLKATPTQIPLPLPILADEKLVEQFRIQRSDKFPVIGICYSAGELLQGGRKVRSLSEGQAMRLVTSTAHRIHWVNLQHRQKMPQPVVNFPIDTWQEFAGLIQNLDGVVSVDTGVYHLAGAMGKQMATILAANSCWKYGMSGKKDPWYPTSILYRNKVHGMEDAVTELIQDINTGAIF
jgi:hypothetical protein